MSLRSEAMCRHPSSKITFSPQISKAKHFIHLPRFVCQNKQLNLNRHVQGSNPNCRLQTHGHFQKTSTRYSVRFISYLLQSMFIFAFSPPLNQSFDSCELILFIAGSYGSVHKGSCYNLLASLFSWCIVCNENKHSFPSWIHFTRALIVRPPADKDRQEALVGWLRLAQQLVGCRTNRQREARKHNKSASVCFNIAFHLRIILQNGLFLSYLFSFLFSSSSLSSPSSYWKNLWSVTIHI